MGCDIHLFTERKRSIDKIEKWVNIDYFKLNPYYGIDKYESQLEVVELYGSRNYRLFSILANVRNYHDNKFISLPKGFPEDSSEFVKSEKERWDGDGHSHSYFTLKELKDFRKENGLVKYAGVMSPKDAELVDKGEMPNSWCQGTTDTTYVYREWQYDNDALSGLIRKIEERKKEDFWIFDDDEHPEHDENIRIVFWFDN